MEIEVAMMERVFKIAFNHLKEMNIKSVKIDNDYYWDVPVEKRYNPYEEPKPEDLDLGQLSSDWTMLEKTDNKAIEPTCNTFIWLSSICKALGEYGYSGIGLENDNEQPKDININP